MSCNPTTAIIFPDPVLEGPRNVHSATSQAGARTPEVVIGDDNCGNLVPMLQGTPTLTAPFEILLQRSGTRREAGFIYRRGSSGDYIGGDDGRKLWRHHAVFTSGLTPNAEGTSLAYCSDDDTLICACIETAQIKFQTRDAHAADYDTWTTTTLVPSSIGAPTPTAAGSLFRIALAYTADGILLCAYTYEDGTTGRNEIALLKSTDCGATWSLLHSALLEQTNDIATPGGQIHLTVSGRWVRLDWLNLAEDAIRSRASSDNGLSWSDVVETDTSDVPLPGTGPTMDPSPFGVCGIGSGQFAMVYARGTFGTFISSAVASTASAWSTTPGGTLSAFLSRAMLDRVVGVVCIRAHERVYTLVSTDDGVGTNTDDQVSMYYQDIARFAAFGPGTLTGPNPGEWQPVEPLTGFQGAKYIPALMRGVQLGRSMFLHWGNYDHEADAEVGGDKPFAALSGQTVRSLGAVGPGGNLMSLPASGDGLPALYDVHWATPYGEAAGGASASADTSWTRPTIGAPVFTWTARQLNINTGVADQGFYAITQPSSPTDSWSTNHAEVCAVFRVTSGSSQVSLLHGLRITSERPSGNELQIQVRVNSTGFQIWDVPSATTLATISIDMTDWVELRLTLFGGSGYVWAARIDDYLNPQEAGSFVFTSAVAGPTDTLWWGAPGTGAGNSDWREVWVSKDTGSITFSNPDDLLPLACTTEDTLMQDGIYIAWGGGSGAAGDSYTTEESYTYALASVFRDENTIGWRSLDTTANTLILVADPDDDEARFIHEAVMLTGIWADTVTVDYDNNPAFPSPVGTTTLSGITHSALEVASVEGNTITFTAADVAAAGLYAGELAGQVCRFTTSAGSFAYLVSRHPTADTIDVVEITSTGIDAPDLSASGANLAAGDDCQLNLTYAFGDVPSGPIVRRYMRVQFNSAPTPSGDHRWAGLVSGPKLSLPFPIEWTWQDDEQDATELLTGPWLDSGFRRGANSRAIVGRIVADYVEWRSSLRELARHLASYQVRPVGLIIDKDDPRRGARVRYVPEAHENAFWYPGATATERWPGGDQTLRFNRVK